MASPLPISTRCIARLVNGLSLSQSRSRVRNFGFYALNGPFAKAAGGDYRFDRTECATLGTGARRPIPGPADRLLRLLYDEFVHGDAAATGSSWIALDETLGLGRVRRLVDRLAELDGVEGARLKLRETKGDWRVDNAA